MASVIQTMVRYKLTFFVPVTALSACKAAVFAAGAGRYSGPGTYTECCWTSIGTGQFRPGDASNPHIGKAGALEEVEEAKVETVCFGEDATRKAIRELKNAHPYEVPVYEVSRLEDF